MSGDISSCELEPIATPERIQSFGFLLALSHDWIVVRASTNLENFLGVTWEQAIGRTLDSLVDRDALHNVRNRLAGLSAIGGVERLYAIPLAPGLPPLDLAIHRVASRWVLEGEVAGPDGRADAASLVRSVVAQLSKITSLDDYHREAARQIRRMTGFNRVMIYRFAADGTGEVVAEEMPPGTQTFLGLRFPASDIPRQARALYLLNPFRIIADVSAAVIPIVAANHDTPAPLDLSLSVTRAVSPVHIAYLINMGVAASLSISIVIDGVLWGLVVCHHTAARLPPFVTRSAAELLGQMYSMMLESRLAIAREREDAHARASTTRMLATLETDVERVKDSRWLQDQIRPLIDCDGAVVCVRGSYSGNGLTPPRPDVEAIVSLMKATSANDVYHTDHVRGLSESLAASGPAAGALGFALSPSYDDYILLFRSERAHEITWAGDPTASAAAGEPTRPSPRKSFAAFSESVRDRSRPFSVREKAVADSIRSGFTQLLSRSSHSPNTERRFTAQRQELLIAELNHRVRNIFALIRGLIMQTNAEGGDAANYVSSLSGRVQALARAHDRVTRNLWGPGPLSAIFEDEIAAYVPTQRHRFVISGLDVQLHPMAFSSLALVVHELVTNCLKYGSFSKGGRVDVTLAHTRGHGLVFEWRESGGPTIAPPTRRGFGSVIIERVLPFDLQGRAQIDYLPIGLSAAFFIPDVHVASVGGPQAAAMPSVAVSPPTATTGAPGRDLLRGLAVLLVEDNLIVAIDAETMLLGLGAAVVLVASSMVNAKSVIRQEKLDFAVLDVNLGGEKSFDLAALLREAKIPFIFATGYGDHVGFEEADGAIVTISKPYEKEALTAAVDARCAPPLVRILQNDSPSLRLRDAPFLDFLQGSEATEAGIVVVQTAIADARGLSGVADGAHKSV